AVILAAGKSTRMKSELPKVLHDICGRPMLAYALHACADAGVGRIVVVVGHGKEQVVEAFSGWNNCSFVTQSEQKGTGHAVLCCRDALAGFAGQVLVIAGDMPLLRGPTLRALLNENARTGQAITLATTILDDPTGYGRIIRDDQGGLSAIVEHNDCTPEQLAVREVNPSYYCFAGRRMFEAMEQVGTDNAKGEYYITDAVKILIEAGHGRGAVAAVPPVEAMGINSRDDLAAVGRIMQDRIQAAWLEAGVTIVDPANTWINHGAHIGPDTIIYPFSYIDGDAQIGSDCRIGPFACLIAGDQIGSGESVGPSALVAGVSGR
ncbi:MAG: bifunctional N-acetylglucosamine-1-phosphate uridyltransferase/glucosamine-1-phosphate acetyltransferase, partial [bacterium]|nr:bifunctional N-acetylglucosamine-1-phosphate uridyltransferase/glucosamine-1-phosphate acetyltransferase [bacterium]